MAETAPATKPPAFAVGARVRVTIPGSVFDGASGVVVRVDLDEGFWVRLDSEWHAHWFEARELIREETDHGSR